MGTIQKWFIGQMDGHTNECVHNELLKRPDSTWNDRFMPVHGSTEEQPVIEFDGYGLVRWLRRNRASLNLKFTIYQQQFPDTPLVEYKLGRLKAGTRLAAEARAKQRGKQTAS